MLNEFREFAIKGNMVDLAIGVIIGAAFNGLVQSVVNDLLMPIIGLITGGIDFSQMFIQLSGEPKATLDQAREAGATLAYGNFITLLINFLIVAAVLFSVLAATDPDTARLFAVMVQRGPDAMASLEPARQAVVQAEIAGAFQAAFLAMSAFTGIGLLLAWSIPLRRI